jgi:D-beta-D-heptose 7-phosphate kinase/D-beta-D-heptose 1-phosphate adenosyltransferase
MSADMLNFDHCRVLAIGDLMIDEYVWGDVDRISPEAPVQIVLVTSEEYTLGGAGNVINNLAMLGANVFSVGVIGVGADGKRILDKLAALGADTEGVVKEPKRRTTRKTRIIGANQQMLRIDRENTRDISEQTKAAIIRYVEAKIADTDIMLISDYGKGLLSKSLLQRLIALAKAHQKPIIADPKGLDFSKYAGVTVLTPNKKEAAQASGMDIRDDAALMKAGYRLLETCGIENLLITCGKDGMILFEPGKEPFKIAAQARQVFDVSGAGDTVLSVLGLAMANGLSLKQGAAIANTAAGIVVGKAGTATVSKQELAAALNIFPDPASLKQKSYPELSALCRELRKKGRRVVLTNGCFDLLHAGHVLLFSASKQLGDILIVAIDDDASVKALKGPGRPVIGEKERVRMLSALDSVDYVTVFSAGELESLIEAIRPDILTKGSTTDKVFGAETVARLGGRVVLVPVIENLSSSEMINTIRNHPEC